MFKVVLATIQVGSVLASSDAPLSFSANCQTAINAISMTGDCSGGVPDLDDFAESQRAAEQKTFCESKCATQLKTNLTAIYDACDEIETMWWLHQNDGHNTAWGVHACDYKNGDNYCNVAFTIDDATTDAELTSKIEVLCSSDCRKVKDLRGKILPSTWLGPELACAEHGGEKCLKKYFEMGAMGLDEDDDGMFNRTQSDLMCHPCQKIQQIWGGFDVFDEYWKCDSDSCPDTHFCSSDKVCETKIAINQTCTGSSEGCLSGLCAGMYNVSSSTTEYQCAAMLSEGDYCDQSNAYVGACGTNLDCNNSVCTAYIAPGEACNRFGVPCAADGNKLYFCNDTSAESTCDEAPWNEGESCSATYFCSRDMGCSSSNECVSRNKADGQNCTGELYDECASYVCNSTSGKCESSPSSDGYYDVESRLCAKIPGSNNRCMDVFYEAGVGVEEPNATICAAAFANPCCLETIFDVDLEDMEEFCPNQTWTNLIQPCYDNAPKTFDNVLYLSNIDVAWATLNMDKLGSMMMWDLEKIYYPGKVEFTDATFNGDSMKAYFTVSVNPFLGHDFEQLKKKSPRSSDLVTLMVLGDMVKADTSKGVGVSDERTQDFDDSSAMGLSVSVASLLFAGLAFQ